jgi:hypothetical protein
MMRIMTVISSLIVITIALPVEHQLIDLSQIDMVELVNLIMTPHVDTSDNHLLNTINQIKDSSSAAVSKLNSQAVHSVHFVESHKDTAIAAAVIPIEVSAQSAAVGGAITAAGAVKGSLIGSAIATPIILKAVALPGLAASKTAAVMAVPALLTHNLHTKVEGTTHRLTNALKKGAVGAVATVGLLKKGAIGLAAKGALVMKKGAVVAGKLMLKPIALIAGSQLKMIGTGLSIGGKVVGATGAGIRKAGTVVKYAGLGSIGLGASAIGWGLDKTTIDKHWEDAHRLMQHN